MASIIRKIFSRTNPEAKMLDALPIEGSEDKLIVPGSEPVVGDVCEIQTPDGEVKAATAGTYKVISVDGAMAWNVTVDENSTATSVEPITEAASSEQVEELSAKIESLTKQLAEKAQAEQANIEKLNTELAAVKEAALKSFQTREKVPPMDNHTPVAVRSTNFNLVDSYRQLKEAQRNGTFRKDLSKRALDLAGKEISRNFATGFDLSYALARCAQYTSEVLWDAIFADPILGMMTALPTEVTNGAANAFDMQIPNMNFNISNDEILSVASNDCTFDPTGEFVPNQRKVSVKPIKFDLKLCPADMKDVWNGLVWAGQEAIPAEAIIMDMLIQRIVNDLVAITLQGRTGTGGTINGLIAEMIAGIASGSIPAAQAITQTNWTDTTAVTKVRELADAMPQHMLRDNGLMLFTPRLYSTYLYRNYLNIYQTAMSTGTSFDGKMLSPDTTSAKVAIQEMFQLDANIAVDGINTFIVNPANFYYVLQNPEAMSALKVTQTTDGTDNILVQFKNYFGVNYGLGTRIVTNKV